MKKRSNFASCALMAIIMISSATCRGSEREKVQAGVKEKVVQQFEESLNRLKRCFKGQCTKVEALKAARDLGVTAVGVITVLYITGSAFQQAAETAYKRSPEQYRESVQSISEPIYKAGYYMRRPGRPVMRKVDPYISKATRTIFPLQYGDSVKYKKRVADVLKYNPMSGNVTLQWQIGGGLVNRFDVPASEVELIQKRR